VLIFQSWKHDELRELFLPKLEKAFPNQYRMVEHYLMTGTVDEYPDGQDEMAVVIERAEVYRITKGKLQQLMLDEHFDAAISFIGPETVVLDEGEDDDDDDEGPSLEDLYGDLPFCN